MRLKEFRPWSAANVIVVSVLGLSHQAGSWPRLAEKRISGMHCTFGKLMSVANRDKRAVVLIARDEDQVARTDES